MRNEYTCWYKSPSDKNWTKIEGVIGDYVYAHEVKPSVVDAEGKTIEESELLYFPVRIIDTADGQRFEIPMTWGIRWDEKKFQKTEKEVEKDAGQPLAIDRTWRRPD